MTFRFWYTPEWKRYCDAYGGGLTDPNGPENIIVPLGSEPEMLARMRKTRRADIRKAMREMQCDIVDKPGVAFAHYQRLHELDAGRKTRPQETFDLMNEWLGTYGLLFLALRDEEYIGAAYFAVYGEGAYYFSAARLPGAKGPIGPFLLWKAMTHLVFRGYRWLDLGREHNAGIGLFKRGFISRDIVERTRRDGRRPPPLRRR